MPFVMFQVQALLTQDGAKEKHGAAPAASMI